MSSPTRKGATQNPREVDQGPRRSTRTMKKPDFNKPFHIDTDASDHQLGAVIMQDKKPISFYSRKLNVAQRRYTITEHELLSTIETCKE
jgi:RNase H-like domain found in reverse transcriptase